MEQTMIKTENVSKRFGSFALQDIHFELPAGYICGLIGENGVGKTTLLNILAGLYEYDGTDIESIRDAYRMVAGERHALRAFGGRLVYMEETPVGCSALVKHDHAEYDRALKVWEPDTEELMYYLAKGAEHGRGNQI